MGLPEDLKNYKASDYEDSFQLIPEDVAGAIVGAVAAVIVIGELLMRLWR
jgi:hypothetical protein